MGLKFSQITDFFASGQATKFTTGVASAYKGVIDTVKAPASKGSGNAFTETLNNLMDSAKAGSFIKKYGLFIVGGLGCLGLVLYLKFRKS